MRLPLDVSISLDRAAAASIPSTTTPCLIADSRKHRTVHSPAAPVLYYLRNERRVQPSFLHHPQLALTARSRATASPSRNID
jgi:hypothetical protein